MSELATPEVDIDLIDVVDGFNARKKFPKEELEQLAGTIEEIGLVQPIKVKQKDDGRFDLVAGERRFRAAKIAGLEKVEITLSTGNPYAETLVENLHRANLTRSRPPSASRRSPRSTTSTPTRRSRPKRANARFGSALTCDSSSCPRPSSATSPPATCRWTPSRCCDRSPRSPRGSRHSSARPASTQLTGRQFVQGFGELFERAPHIERMKNVPTMIGVPRFSLSDAIPGFDCEKEEHAKLMKAAIAAFYYYAPLRPRDAEVQLAEPEIDRARAAGVLVEHIEDDYSRAFVVDREMALDLVHSAIERATAEREEAAK